MINPAHHQPKYVFYNIEIVNKFNLENCNFRRDTSIASVSVGLALYEHSADQQHHWHKI